MRYLLTALILLCSSVSSAFSQPTICIIHSYHKEYAWEKGLTSGLLNALPAGADLRHFYLDTKRTLKEKHAQRAEAVWEEIRDISWDLVILCDDNASKFLGPRFMNGPIPVVYVGMNRNPRDYGLFPAPNMTGVLERPLLKRSLHSMCRLVNTADTKVLVLFDSDLTSDAIVHEAFHGKSTLTEAVFRHQRLAERPSPFQSRGLRHRIHRAVPHPARQYGETCARRRRPGLGQRQHSRTDLCLLGLCRGQRQDHRRPCPEQPRPGSRSGQNSLQDSQRNNALIHTALHGAGRHICFQRLRTQTFRHLASQRTEGAGDHCAVIMKQAYLDREHVDHY